MYITYLSLTNGTGCLLRLGVLDSEGGSFVIGLMVLGEGTGLPLLFCSLLGLKIKIISLTKLIVYCHRIVWYIKLKQKNYKKITMF